MILLTFFFLGVGRLVNVMVPIQTGRIVRELEAREFNLASILLYVLYRYLQGGSGIVNAARRWAWIPIEQYCKSSLTIRFFEHVHNLSLQFHLSRKTGELLRIFGQGKHFGSVFTQYGLVSIPTRGV